MISRLHQRLGTAGFVLSIVALIAALAGGAYAAGGLSSAEKKQITKESKKFSKKFSQQFATPGANGPQGPPGAKGDKGDAGTNGTNGTDGKSVVTETEAAGTGNCAGLGGAKFHQVGSGTNTFACNGKTGYTETLPEGKTETGTWSFYSVGGRAYKFGETVFYTSAEVVMQPLSFNIPLEEAPDALVFMEPGDTNADCPGTLEDPQAAPGKFCVYAEGELQDPDTKPTGTAHFPSVDKLYVSGAILGLKGEAANMPVWGTWAVTAQVAP